MGGGFPTALHKRERALEAERAGNHSALGGLRAFTLCTHQRDPWRWDQSGITGNERGGERGFGAARNEGLRRSGKRRVAETAPEGKLCAAVAGALGIRCGQHGEATVWTSGRRQTRLQPHQAGTTLACLSQLLYRQRSHGAGHGGAGGQSDGSVVCATWIVGVPGRTGGRGLAGISTGGLPLGSGECDGRSRETRDSICVQTEAERECEEATRAGVPARGMGGGGARMAGEGGPTAAERVEPGAASRGIAQATGLQNGDGRKKPGPKKGRPKSCLPDELGSAGDDPSGSAV